MKYECDLHCHTTRSDGADTPAELIVNAEKAGLRVLAITDHDRRPPAQIRAENGEIWDAGAYAGAHDIFLLKGIEISCETEAEDVHIVCFGCEWTDPYFDRLEEDTVRSKIESYRELVRGLNGEGIHISWEEVLDNGGRPVCEREVQKKMIFELMAQRYVIDRYAAFASILSGGSDYHADHKKGVNNARRLGESGVTYEYFRSNSLLSALI